MPLDTLVASLLGNLLLGKGVIRACDGVISTGDGIKYKKRSLMPSHPLTNIQIQSYYQNKCKFKGIYS